MTSGSRPRDYLFDNCKAFLILLVVLGHFTEAIYQQTEFLYSLKWLAIFPNESFQCPH